MQAYPALGNPSTLNVTISVVEDVPGMTQAEKRIVSSGDGGSGTLRQESTEVTAVVMSRLRMYLER
ncbi:MAG: hypothetical protein R2756_00130 [Bacteroidales bacterium]